MMTNKDPIICVHIGRSTWQGRVIELGEGMGYFLERDDENGHRIVRRYSALLNGDTIGDDFVSVSFPKGVSYDNAQDAFYHFMTGKCQ